MNNSILLKSLGHVKAMRLIAYRIIHICASVSLLSDDSLHQYYRRIMFNILVIVSNSQTMSVCTELILCLWRKVIQSYW